MKTIAIVSPQSNAYSESFIAAHKRLLPFQIKYYYGGLIPCFLEGGGRLMPGRLVKLIFRIARKFVFSNLALNELLLLFSLKRNNVSAVLAEYGPTGMAVCKVCHRLKLPLLVHFHGYDASVESIIKDNDNYIEVFNYASAIFVVSKVMEKKLVDLGCSRSKIVYNVYGPDRSFLDVSPRFDNQTFVSLGRFVNKKAPYYTILAFSILVDKFPDAKLIMAGAGELSEVCANLVTFLKLNTSVHLIGIIDHNRFKGILSDCLCFVQHSITAENGDMEGTPVAILEANAAGVPVISTNHAGIPDVIVHGLNGYLVKEHDVEMMAAYMIELIENPNRAREMGRNGRSRIMESYSLEKHITCIAGKIRESFI